MIPKNWSANNRKRFFSFSQPITEIVVPFQRCHAGYRDAWTDKDFFFRNLDTRGNGVQRRLSKADKPVISRLS
jgi:hypothetical protein